MNGLEFTNILVIHPLFLSSPLSVIMVSSPLARKIAVFYTRLTAKYTRTKTCMIKVFCQHLVNCVRNILFFEKGSLYTKQNYKRSSTMYCKTCTVLEESFVKIFSVYSKCRTMINFRLLLSGLGMPFALEHSHLTCLSSLSSVPSLLSLDLILILFEFFFYLLVTAFGFPFPHFKIPFDCTCLHFGRLFSHISSTS